MSDGSNTGNREDKHGSAHHNIGCPLLLKIGGAKHSVLTLGVTFLIALVHDRYVYTKI